MGIKQMIAAMEALIPEAGANVVAVDDYEEHGSGEELYLVEHCASEAEGREALAKFKRAHPNAKAYLYTPEMRKK